jgi:hypothetical protein
MKKWLSQNWFKLIVGIAILAIGVGIFYYLAFALPAATVQKNDQATASQEAQCSQATQRIEAGAVQTQQQIAQMFAFPGTTATDKIENEEYEDHFNQKLNTCFAEISIISCEQKCGQTETDLFDVYENKLLASCYGTTAGASSTCTNVEEGTSSQYPITQDQFNKMVATDFESN